MDKLTAAQKKVIDVLSDCGGWICYEALRKHGAAAASATTLANNGLIEKRMSGGNSADAVFPFAEWRIKPK
jgi:hypothetical protein